MLFELFGHCFLLRFFLDKTGLRRLPCVSPKQPKAGNHGAVVLIRKMCVHGTSREVHFLHGCFSFISLRCLQNHSQTQRSLDGQLQSGKTRRGQPESAWESLSPCLCQLPLQVDTVGSGQAFLSEAAALRFLPKKL